MFQAKFLHSNAVSLLWEGDGRQSGTHGVINASDKFQPPDQTTRYGLLR